jgi:tetratricopeptide (TPR) repeat protein
MEAKNMNFKRYMIIAGIAVCVFLTGCPNNNSPRVDQHLRAASDFRKNELLKQLDQKWENPTAHYELGQLYHASGDYAKAEYYYNIALGFNPAYREVQASMVKLQIDKGDKSRADWVANNYITQVASSPEQILSLGIAFEKQGMDDYALRCYQEGMKIAPDSYKISRQLGYFYLARNKKDLARDMFIRSFQLNSNQPDVALELGKLGVSVRIPEPQATPSDNLNQTVKPATQPK